MMVHLTPSEYAIFWWAMFDRLHEENIKTELELFLKKFEHPNLFARQCGCVYFGR